MKAEDIYALAAKVMVESRSAGALIIVFHHEGNAGMFMANDGSTDGKVPDALRKLADSIEAKGGMARKGAAIAFTDVSKMPNNPANS